MLERAAELTKLSCANVVVTSVAQAVHGKRHEAELKCAAAQLAALGIGSVTTVVGIGDPAHAILHAAEEHGADLIVLGALQGGALSRVISGSVGDTVSHKAHADVLIVHLGRLQRPPFRWRSPGGCFASNTG